MGTQKKNLQDFINRLYFFLFILQKLIILGILHLVSMQNFPKN